MRRRMPRIEAIYERPLDLQFDGLRRLITEGRETEWGKKYGYEDFTSYETFRQRVPISTYE